MEQTDDKTESSAPETANEESQNELTFETLTPTNLSETEMQGYTQALDFIFKEDDLRNIAITGPYASGKSSVIKTYVNKQYKLKGIYISLAYFSPALESKIKGKKQDNNLIFEDELILERKIINQLIHQIDPNEVPDTEFRIKSEPKKKSNRFWAGILSLMISCLIFIDKGSLINSQDEYFFLALFSLLVFLGLTTLVIDKIINLQNRKNLIRKLKIFENEIDISSSVCEVSYFDKYLDEIIYILNKSQLDYIVFEDIDRYDDNLILNKLRELNYIYNKKYGKNNPKPIKFFYLIKDEIFESKDRTKFFDYILPIVPVMDNANSLGKMEQIFKERNIRKDFSTTFLDTLSLYLDDIRLIKNICNEYIIYKTKIAHNDNEFKNENLLAIIVYKNMFPADFSLTRLGLGQGVVHRIIDSLEKQKNKYCQEEIQKIDDKINHLKQDVQSGGGDKSSAHEAEQKLIEEKKRLKLPNKITEFIEIKQYEGIHIEDLFEEHIKEKTKQPEYKAEYEKLSSSCYFPLLRVLIIQGYIDEYYSDYTSAYNEHGLPRNDILFLRNIYECKSSDKGNWKLELTKPELVFERLKRYKNIYFNREYVLNYSLLDYSLATSNVYKLDNLSLFISLLEPLHGNQVHFINAYLERYYSLLREERMTLALVRKNTDIILQKLSVIQTEIQIEIQKMKTILLLILEKDRLRQKAREAQEQELETQARTLEAHGLEAQVQELKAEAQAKAQKLKAEAQELKAEAQELKAEALEAQELEAQELAAQAQGLEAQAEALEALAQAEALEAQAQAQKPLEIEKLAQVQTQALETLALALEKLTQAKDTLVTAKQEARYKPKYLGLWIQQLNQQFPLLWQQIYPFNLKLYLYFYLCLLFINNNDLSTLGKMNEDQKLKNYIDNSADFLLIEDELYNILNFNNYWLDNIAKISITFEALNIKFKKIAKSTPQLLKMVETGYHYELNQANVQHILENSYHQKNFATYIIQTLLALDEDAPVKSYFQRNPEKLVLSITASDIAPINDNEETVLFILNHERISPEAKIAYIDKLSTVITELNQITDEEIREKLRQKQK
ncbi:hypothetical protein BGI30_01485 [Snodgrassella alvi]|uniref:YobI family P-loop NTPase n=1 Tax=Snodgrassella alvi TaxID=1196083 RepID=UPI000C1EC845|nr:hypothetical protein [Snodgrassella alvi]PIT13470.1 hypothetical protein BGI30_01485 [Snodgrassella alvi]PIT54673.1 hypothetical protein BHC59_12235 [Snodgrassella alvi]